MRSSYVTHVMLAVLIVVASTEAKHMLSGKKKLEMRPVIGGFLLGIFLFIIGAVHENTGRAFAVIAVLSALVTIGTKSDRSAGLYLADALTPRK